MKSELIIIPHLTIHPDKICTWNEVHYSEPHSRRSKVSAVYLDVNSPVDKFRNSKRKNNGSLSIHAKRKLNKAIDYLLITSTEKKQLERLSGKMVCFKIAFVTITLPSEQIHPDSVIISKCFNQLLTELRTCHNVKKYVWRAERQKNGNIHFHILTDAFIPYYELRNRWNRIINKLGYVDRFKEKNGNKQPNSTDIHSTRKIGNLKKYLAKYMSKEGIQTTGNETEYAGQKWQSGSIWNCSTNLSNIKGCDLIVDSEIEAEFKKVIDKSNCHKFEGDYFKVFYIDAVLLTKYGSELLFKYFSDYLISQFNFHLQLKFAV